MYEESWRCNFLGQGADTVLPDHVLSDERFLLVEVLLRSKEEEQLGTSLDSDLSVDEEGFQNYEFRLISPVSLPDKSKFSGQIFFLFL